MMIRLAVAGAGAFGKNHLRVIRENPRAVLAGVFDVDREKAEAAGCHVFESLAAMRGQVDAAIVATPTSTHAAVACELASYGIDLLIEKPLASDVESARRILDASPGRIVQAGHLERFNPAVLALKEIVTTPLFFEIHRMSQFSPRSLDVDVVLDLMIHDIDLVLDLVGQAPEEVRAAGVSVLSEKVDIANVRLAFPSGCVANLTASRVSTERIRKLRLFQPHQYISADYTRQEGVVFTVSEGRQVGLRALDVHKQEPLKAQLDAFLDCVTFRTPPLCGAVAAARALEVALEILAKIEEHAKIVRRTLGSHSSP